LILCPFVYAICGDGYCEAPETPETCQDCICKKWNPGHYVYKTGQSTFQDIENVLSNSSNHITGVEIKAQWRDLEPEKDVYNFSIIDEYLEMVKEHDKHLVVMFADRVWHSVERPVPDYLYDDPIYNGGVEPCDPQKKNGSVARLWDPAVMERSNLLVNALGERYNNDSNFETLDFVESSLCIVKANASGYSPQAYVELLKSRVDSAKAAFPSTVVIQEMNWGEVEVIDFIHYLDTAGAGMGGPDLVPDEGRVIRRMPAYDYYPIYADKIPLGVGVQYPNLVKNSHKGNFTLDGFWDMGLNTLKLNYIYWGYYDENWMKFKFMDDILPYINERNGEINDECPENHIFRTDCGDGNCSAAENCTSCPDDCIKVHDADNNPCNGIISIRELIDYLDAWKIGDVAMTEIVTAIIAWKNQNPGMQLPF